MDAILASFRQKLEKAIDHLKSELGLLRTGKATVQLLDPVRVEAYGTVMGLNEVARISAPDPSQLVITPYDASLLAAIEKAVASSGLNLQPVIEGNFIRISVPALTQERRQEMVKLLHQKLEQGRVMIRTIRADTKKDIERQEGQEGVSEDHIKATVAEMETIVKSFLEQIDGLGADKERELLTV